MEFVISQPTQCEGKRTDGSKPLVILDTPGLTEATRASSGCPPQPPEE